jgi:RNA polymerase sigma-70 factor (ECF subfamily)
VLCGQREFFYELVRPYERRVYVTAFAILKNEADAEDVAQESILKAFRALSTFRGEARFSTWLLRITMNEVRMRLRSRRSEFASVPIEDEEGREYIPLLMTNWKEVPSEVLERHEVREQIQKAMAALSEEHREVLILRDVQGLNIVETASVLGVSIASVKTRLLRARLRMRDLLASYFRTSPGPVSQHGRKRWF